MTRQEKEWKEGKLGEVRGHLRAVQQYPQRAVWREGRYGVRTERFTSFQGIGAQAEDGLQAEAKMLLVTQCPTEQEKGLAVWCLLYTVLQNRQGKYPSVGRTVN